MAVVMKMEPKTPPLSFREFCQAAPPFSIALDGYVNEGPREDLSGPWLNLNHHEGVSRIDTYATCGQVLNRIRADLFDLFSDGGGPKAMVYMNDCDQDVALSWTEINNPHIFQNTMNPLANRLVGVVNTLDMCAGAYPYPKTMPFLRELAWIFEPYRQCRQSGELDKRAARTFVRVVTDVEQRILSHIAGRGGTTDLDLAYEVIGGGKKWVMVLETGADARTAMFSDGVRSFIAVRDRHDGTWTYSYGRISPYDGSPPLQLIYDAANKAEGIAPDDPNRHGGADTIGGSPRATGSKISPNEMEAIRNRVQEAWPS